jgi:hypothetical protein
VPTTPAFGLHQEDGMFRVFCECGYSTFPSPRWHAVADLLRHTETDHAEEGA